MSVIPALGRQRLEDQKFKVILSYILGSRPAWPMLDPFSKKEKKNPEKKDSQKYKAMVVTLFTKLFFENIF